MDSLFVGRIDGTGAGSAQCGTPQWWVLRRWVGKAAWWIPANAVAWAGGIVAIFTGMNFVPFDGPAWAIAVSVLLVLAIAGAIVGAIHGVVLVRLLDDGE